MHDRIGLELKTNPSLEPMKVTLNLSYRDFPYYLKPCFLYLSIFPEDSVISRMRIVRRWVAEGFVEGREGVNCLLKCDPPCRSFCGGSDKKL